MSDQAEPPHDILAAEEFAVPAPDPGLHAHEPHDILAAEEFVVPAPDPALRIHSAPLVLPPDPKDPRGAEPVHDVLAAEEFAVPAPQPEAVPSSAHRSPAGRPERTRVYGAVAALAGAFAFRRLRRRSRHTDR